MRLRGLSGARDEFHLAAIVQNLKTLASFFWRPRPHIQAVSFPHISFRGTRFSWIDAMDSITDRARVLRVRTERDGREANWGSNSATQTWPTETRLRGWRGRTRTQKCRRKLSL
jgi:hypothetical protein